MAIDAVASGLFAACAGWSVAMVGGSAVAIAAGAGVAGIVALFLLRRVGGSAGRHGFALSEAEFDEPVDDTLLLEDRLSAPAEDSQVVRLFAVGSGHTEHRPGELANQIDRFLGRSGVVPRAAAAQPDAAQELYEALAQIRQTLR